MHVLNEWGALSEVVVGIGTTMGGTPALDATYDPKSREHVLAGTYPSERDVTRELNGLARMLEDAGVKVLRPRSLGVNQVFTRDIAVVVADRWIVTSMVEDRTPEQAGVAQFMPSKSHVLRPPSGVRLEGGDIMPMDGELWVGYSNDDDFDRFVTARTNAQALDWLADQFPDWNVRGFQLSKSDSDPRENALHLDCCFMPLGGGHAVVHVEGLKRPEDCEFLRTRFAGSLLEVDAQAMYDMQCNLFSVNPSTVVSDQMFVEVNRQLTRWGYDVWELDYQEIAKMEGLLRCTTLPLLRS